MSAGAPSGEGRGSRPRLRAEKRNRKGLGLGLGLAISRKGAEAVGGTLTVMDLPHHGCVFAIDPPRLLPKPPARAQRAQLAASGDALGSIISMAAPSW